jgi:integrase
MPKRRGHNDGSIYQRESDGRWVASISLPFGKRKSIYGKTRTEVQAKLRQAQRDQENGLNLNAKRETVTKFLERWLAASVEPVAKRKTWEGYESIIRIRIKPRSIGQVELTRLTPVHLQELYAELATASLSARSIRHTHAMLHKAFAQAVRWGLLVRNPCDGATPPRPPRTEMKVLTAEQSAAFLTATRNHSAYALYALALTTGARQGELLALRWADVDLDNGRLMVQRALQRQRGGLTFTSPKTSRSRRTIMLSETAIAALKHHRSEQNLVRLKMGSSWQDGDLIFANEIGNPLDPSWQTAVFKVALKDAGLPAIRFHDLRHTAATLLLAKGVHPKVVADMLGHATITITLDTYSAYVPAMHTQAAATMDAILSA